MNLYQLTTAQHDLIAKLEAADFDSQTIADTLEGEENSVLLQEKRLGYIAIIKQKQALAAMRKAAAADILALADKDASAPLHKEVNLSSHIRPQFQRVCQRT